MLETLTKQFHFYADKLPLELFTFSGAFVEEVIAPIPSPLVLTLAGSVASAQSLPILNLLWLILIGALGKTLGAYLLYVVTDKAEDVVFAKLGKYLGITHEDIEKLGDYFGKGKRNGLILFLMRALPIIPSAPISILCGFIKFNLKSFLTWTFFGSVVRNAFFIYLGYFGLASTDAIVAGFDTSESISQIVIAGILAIGGIWMYVKRFKGDNPHEIISKLTGKK